MMDRSEHVRWCKTRALEYVDAGQLQQALASLYSDLGKHPETAGHPVLQLGMGLQMMGALSTSGEVRRFVDGVA